MKVTLLGTGTSSGVPVLTCDCQVCSSVDPRDNRLRVSAYFDINGTNILIDSGPDFRQQALRYKIQNIDAILYTHEHKDHTAGLDDIRPYNYLNGLKNCPIYAQERVMNQLKSEYYYAFSDKKYPGVPMIEPHVIGKETFEINEIKILPIQIKHHLLDILGYRIGDFSYITDANYIEESEIQKLKGSKILILNALQPQDHISHFNLDQAINMAERIGADQTYFTHIGHRMGLHKTVEKCLPEGMFLAYDGLKFSI